MRTSRLVRGNDDIFRPIRTQDDGIHQVVADVHGIWTDRVVADVPRILKVDTATVETPFRQYVRRPCRQDEDVDFQLVRFAFVIIYMCQFPNINTPALVDDGALIVRCGFRYRRRQCA